MSIPENRPDCSNQCRSKQHGDIITAAISKRSVSDIDLCSFLNFICYRCESVVDSVGRTALHVAASCGRVELVKWLVTSRHADINAKDRESGYTALHRSVFYGKIHVAVQLVKLGASTAELDSDSLTALEHSMKDGLKPDLVWEGELYSWGSNTNNLLGPQQAKQTPELLDIFHKKYPGEYVQSICISQFHTVIITSSGKALSCGHGQGGRLGLGDEKAVVSPHTISFSSSQKGDTVTCLQASIARDHSIFLCSDDNIYTCGLNVYHVLGQSPPPERALFPKPIKHFSKQIQGVCAARYHSVAWGPGALYTWGLNAGQLGHKLNGKIRDRFVVSPRIVSVTNEFGIKMVAASTGATAVCTQKGDIYVLHEYLCRKIASRQLNIVQISIVGGKLDSTQLDRDLSKEYSKELRVGVLTNTGIILLWQESDQQLCRCIYNINRAIVVKQISLNLNELLFVSDFGEAFKGIVRARRKNTTGASSKNSLDKSAFHKFLDRDECVMVSLEKVAKIHRAVIIQSDLKGKDYCVIQTLPYKSISFPEIATSHMKCDLEALIADVDETDNVHDVVFKVDNRYFPAHKYILYNSSSYLEKLMDQKNRTIVLNDVNPDVFEQFLLYVYKGECELTKCGELKNERLRRLCPVKEKLDESLEIENIPANISAYEYYNKKKTDDKEAKLKNKSSRNPVRLLHELAKRFECLVLQKTLARLDMEKYMIILKQDGCAVRENLPTFNRLDFPNLYDVLVKCRDNKEIKAHKCILSARMEYFANMFSLRWGGEQTTEVSLPFPKSTVEALLEFLYTDSLSILSSIDTDHLFKILILADQLFVTRLKDQCERLLSDNLTLRNVIQILLFAHVYNAEKLKVCCMKFMVLNMAPLLESRALDELDEELLKELSEFYFQEKREVWCRVITPYSTAVLDEVVLTVGMNNPVSMTDQVELTPSKPVQKRKPRSHRVSEKNLSVSFDNDVPLDSIIQFPDEPESLPKNNSLSDLPGRLKSINLASEIVKSETVETQYTKLGSNRSHNSMELSFSFNESSNFPELNSPPLHSNSSFQAKSPTQKGAFKHKMVKISQKERKRLSSGSNNETCNDSISMIVTPKNPWKTISVSSSPATSTELKHIGDIISDEKKQKENLIKLTTKSLVFTQLEDKAIDDLHKFYNTENFEDEIIVIERVNIGAIARPVWVPKTK